MIDPTMDCLMNMIMIFSYCSSDAIFDILDRIWSHLGWRFRNLLTVKVLSQRVFCVPWCRQTSGHILCWPMPWSRHFLSTNSLMLSSARSYMSYVWLISLCRISKQSQKCDFTLYYLLTLLPCCCHMPSLRWSLTMMITMILMMNYII